MEKDETTKFTSTWYSCIVTYVTQWRAQQKPLQFATIYL